KLWWFGDKIFAARLEQVPLTERVEETVFRSLHEKGRVSFTEVWDTVAREFPNSLTSDSTSNRIPYLRKTHATFFMKGAKNRKRSREFYGGMGYGCARISKFTDFRQHEH